MVAKNVSILNPLVMWFLVSLSIGFVTCDGFLSNGELGPRYEAYKINKGIWLRHRQRADGRENWGHFFRSNSNENEPDAPFVGALSLRDKRSVLNEGGKRHINNGKGLIKEKNSITSLFNDFPLSAAMLLENSNNKNLEYNGYTKSATKTAPDVENITNAIQENHTSEDDHFNYLNDILNITEVNATAKRSMKYDDLVVDRIDLIDMFNKSNDLDKTPNVSREKLWQNAPVSDKNAYEMLTQEPTTESATPKPISEKGLVKVLSMLTRTFKKIMKQHNAIKVIHNQMNNVNKEFEEKIEVNTKKLNDFDVKYLTVLKLIEKLNNFHDCLKNKEQMFRKKEEIISKNMLDFESQQSKFLSQQQQFYNIQKMMLLQNEKINEKQNSIAKIQNEISHRQNHFANILKKAKQSVQNNKYLKVNADLIGPKKHTEKNTTKMNYVQQQLTTERTTSIEPIKINLLSMPSNNVIENQDQMILREKDDKSVDDLIYKYYFNNTFIDTIIKNKILGGIHMGDKTSIARSAKLSAKRNQKKPVKNDTKPKTTFLFPVDKISFKRERRWINHHSTRKHRKRHHSKGHPLIKDNQIKRETVNSTTEAPKVVKQLDLTAKDPFLMMATSFCKEIGQNSTKQILEWCVEKAIRRLRTLDKNMMAPNIVPMLPEQQQPSEKIVVKPTTPTTTTTHATEAPVSITTTPPALFVKDTQKLANKIELSGNQFFPDNQELEQNLKAFDLTPDTAGNVYFDGSLHASDILGDKQSEGLSDVLPGYDSNSKIELDPRFIRMQLKKKHLQAK
ncbi:uncharacterized protein LOC134753474 [Cydia strobilella]|uniref:uncharacterized protein LOC134753474 n=1 Tax=Cydia strobilella TaxID=1100964 RepID=UPI0030074967